MPSHRAIEAPVQAESRFCKMGGPLDPGIYRASKRVRQGEKVAKHCSRPTGQDYLVPK